SGLLPDDYNLKISAPDFYPWDKKIDVHSGITSEFWNVVLTRTNYESTKYEATLGIEKFFTSPKNDFMAYTQTTDNELSVKILELDNSNIVGTYLLPDWKLLADEKKENIEWSPEENYLSVPVENNATSNYYIIDLSAKNLTNLNEFFGKNDIKNVRWDPKEKGYFFFLDNNTLFRGNISDKNYLAIIAENTSAFELSYDSVYYIQLPNNLIFKTSLDGKKERTQITDNFPGAADSIISRIIIYDESRIAFLDQAKNLFIYNNATRDEYFKLIGNNVLEMHFSNDGKKLLFWTANEISVYFTRDWDVQPIRKENDLQNITRYFEPLQNIQWYKDYEHVIFSVGKYTKLIELDPRDHRNCSDLINTEIESPFINYNHGLEKLFFTNIENGQLILNSINFPEATTILDTFVGG
ncbi:MAG: hypothetical protein WAV31_03270, partial [Candidatus Moraniibacteriota bacterium]